MRRLGSGTWRRLKSIACCRRSPIGARSDLADLDSRLQGLKGQIEQAEGEAELQDVGVYRYRHRLDDAVAPELVRLAESHRWRGV